jgi:cytochrome c oxidase cbb3-type subunit 4
MDITTMRILATLGSFATFIAIWAWAWSKKNSHRFDEAAHLPFENEDRP